MEQNRTSAIERGELLPCRVLSGMGREADVELSDSSKQPLRVYVRPRLQAVAGDCGWCTPPQEGQSAVLVLLQDRRNLLERREQNRTAPIAANLDLAVVVVAPQPPLSLRALDRALTLVCSSGMEALILLNKCELVEEVPQLQPYAHCGFEVLRVSALEKTNLDALRARLHGKTALFTGQSGVGKTSLLNVLAGRELDRTGDLTKNRLSGQHTTTATRLYHMDGFDLIDSPGVRQLQTWHLQPQQLLLGFPDIAAEVDRCKFRNCRHCDERGCAVREAVAAGMIDPVRLAAYRELLGELESP